MAIVNDVLENPGHDGIVRVGEIVHECVQSPPPLPLSLSLFPFHCVFACTCEIYTVIYAPCQVIEKE
jgi:hypothetical protein